MEILDLLEKIRQLEKIRDYSIFLEIQTDQSGVLIEFWSEERIFEFETVSELENFLNEETDP